MMKMIKTYSEMSKFQTFEERFAYLKLDGVVGEETFGWDRYLNQVLYRSLKWRQVRDKVIIRDAGCDLGVKGHEIYGRTIIHHMNPITIEDIKNQSKLLYDPENLICVSLSTHNAIHYGDVQLLQKEPKQRFKNDTCPWKHD